jgi:hypothetical protein
MVAAVMAEARVNTDFARLLSADVLAVLAAKQAAGLLTCP